MPEKTLEGKVALVTGAGSPIGLGYNMASALVEAGARVAMVDVNEEWLSDKARYQVDGLMRRRLDKVFVRRDGKLAAASWDEAFAMIADAKPGSSIAAIAGDLVDCETMFAAKRLLAELGSDKLEGRQTGLDYDCSSLAGIAFNSTLAGIETADAILIVGSQVRHEAPLINVRLRKAAKRGAKIFLIGPEWDTTFACEFLGEDAGLLHDLPGHVADAFKDASRPAIIVGPGGLAAGALHPALSLANEWNLVRDVDGEAWNGFNVIHTAAARMGAVMLGYAQKGGIKDVVDAAPAVLLSLGADAVDRLWIFPPVRRGRREQGLVAVSTFLDGEDRRVIITAAYTAEQTGGGVTFEASFTQEGEAPPERFPSVMAGVVRRSGEGLGEAREVEILGFAEKFEQLLEEVDMDFFETPHP